MDDASLDEVVADLSAAFAQYPLCRWVVGDSEGARSRLFSVMVKQIAMPAGIISRPAEGGAAAIWLPSEDAKTSFARNIRLVLSLVGRLTLQQFRRAALVHSTMGRYHPNEPLHSYLFLIGVRPEFQGRRTGSQLLKQGLELVDAQNRAAFLETSSERAMELYKCFGFEPVEQYRICPDSPPTWTMWRPASMATSNRS